MSEDVSGTTPPIPEPTKPKTEPTEGEKKFTQAEFEAKLAEQVRDREARLKRQMEAQQREAQQAMEAKQLEEQAEWQKLANRRADEIKDLKPRAALADSYEKAGRDLLEAFTPGIPAATLMILEKLSLPDQIAWITANAKQFTSPPVTAPGTDINAWSRTSTSQPASLTDEEYRARKRAESIYK